MLRKLIHPVGWTAAAALFLTGLLFFYPFPSLEAALRGVSIWWDVLFPALFPFFLISELMLGFGLVHFFGALFDPLMRPLFRIPGIGGFVMAMGFAAGYPVGARLTAQLWSQRLVNREEGERLVAMTTSADPIFLIGAVSVGFFQNAELAVVLAAAHYGGAVLLGLLMRFHGSRAPATERSSSLDQEAGPLLKRAFASMHEARLKDGRPLGLMLQEAVSSSLRLMYVVGGLVVFFSVVMEALRLSGALAPVYASLQTVFQWLAVPGALADAVVNGFFEVTLGAKAAGQAAASPLLYKAMLAAFVLSWGGLSVHAQIASLLHQTNLRYVPFLVARFLHAVLAAVLVPIVWTPLQPVMAVWSGTAGDLSVGYVPDWGRTLAGSATALLLVLAVLMLLSVLLCFLSRRTPSGR
ncbi:sporulation integral membrane protein YlbJ [Paenibacillus sp. J31TS4]|uniref:sporulation integral membrane protein YlbJ n=1 Tax=Paenibacillus sp. J31TS4 TaxID=2807195 RepID=UPI001B0CE7D3|nr:sporulation integral membrane protein YlbJ [Paenibacillus sp. J31TS4]GIP40800.1 sporulation integral membrane protein YlbJ [Paenibacillus sp. J31TS4]